MAAEPPQPFNGLIDKSVNKKHLRVAAPPTCQIYLCSYAYFVISSMCMRMHGILRVNTHQSFPYTNANHIAQKTQAKT